MHVDRVKKCYEFMEQNPDCDMVYTYVDIIDGDTKTIPNAMTSIFNQNKTPSDMLRYFFYNGNFICAASLMIKKDVYRKIHFNPCLLQLQDFDMWVKMLLSGFKIMCLPEKLTHYRIHGNNLSLQKDRKKKIELFSRDQFEHTKVLLNFTDYIKTVEQFEEIFQKTVPHNKLISFAIAQEALLIRRRPYYLFALDVIYNEMLDPVKKEMIYEYYKFEMKDFYTLCNNFIEKDSTFNIVCELVRKIKKLFLH
ncbi:Putative family 2 glycosyl transferase [Candidatus Deianiraea vastatrix]|uniref:Family 2 glycosyl transferase n=1 Tax=Candidatus Deianiraea vastatrix TaxID=2163644 RepID=A0A5B8XGD0_9RICK|nr:hypothetical protein [Candidatus Deianiraea vastatrix]QED23364.1 Putative family 2 glycosyl transferase [Candidatus Deianiraea vastatrix]